MACSWDGSVAYIEFDSKELGHVISVEEKENIFHRMYGKKTFTTGIEKKPTVIIEDPDWIQAQKLDIPCPPSSIIIEDEGGMLSCDSRASRSSQIVAKGPTDKQIETRTVDGKRRITPVFIPPPMEDDDTPSQASNHSTATAPLFPPTFSSSTESKSKIVVEKRDEVTRAGLPTTPPPPPPPPPTANARKEMSTLLLNRRLERSEPERRVATVKTASQSTVSTGISIARTAESDKTAINPLTAQKTLTVLVSVN